MPALEASTGWRVKRLNIMAEFKFACPTCKQNIICDELWCGQQIQCPSCHAELLVPPQQAAGSSSLVPPPPPPGAAPRLSLGRHQPQQSGAAPQASQRVIPGTRPLPPPPKPKSRLVPQLQKTAAVLIVLGVGGYFGYGWWSAKREKANAEAAAAANPAPPPAAAAAPKPLPVLPATWTLDVASAKIPEGQANGTIAGTNFVVDTANIQRSGAAQLLSLRQGTSPPFDRDLIIYLHLGPGETLTGHTWTVSQEMKGAGVPQILKRWKSTPSSAMQQKFFSTGYAMKLELGQAADGTIPGKIFLALPDPEQSVVAGIFKVAVSAEPTAQPVAEQSPAAAVPRGGDKAAFDKRYGVRKQVGR